ncbi:MAG: hypothetical protein ACKPGI_11495, partial [Verrucomicrobiota bacterium]
LLSNPRFWSTQLTVLHRPVWVAGLLLGLWLASMVSALAEEYSIRNPGPDLANFPNSAFTLPRGRAYVELSPVNLSTPNSESSGSYSAGYLLRYGLIDDLELRLFSSGYTEVRGSEGTRGLSPQVLDLKWHVLDEDVQRHLPAAGVEFALETEWASPALRQGWNPALSFNFDQGLPLGIAFEYNVGFFRRLDADGAAQFPAALSWAFQRELLGPVDVFVNGYGSLGDGPPSCAIGGGFVWVPWDRLAAFTNAAAGLTAVTPDVYILVGLAVAF